MDALVMSNKNIGGQDSILLKGAPGWWSEHVYPSPEAIGFIYGWESNKWQRTSYVEEDGFDYVGLLQATSIRGRHSLSEAAADMFGSADENAIAELIRADANVSEETLSKITPKNIAYSGEGDRHFRGNVTDIFNLPHWVSKRNVSGHDQSTFFSFLLSAAFDTSSHRITDQLKAVRPV